LTVKNALLPLIGNPRFNGGTAKVRNC
jgi:hypothetical protein